MTTVPDPGEPHTADRVAVPVSKLLLLVLNALLLIIFAVVFATQPAALPLSSAAPMPTSTTGADGAVLPEQGSPSLATAASTATRHAGGGSSATPSPTAIPLAATATATATATHVPTITPIPTHPSGGG